MPDLPSLERFGEELAAAGRAQDAAGPRGRWALLRGMGIGLAVLLGVGATAVATAATLRGTVIPEPDPRVVPAEQSPLAGSTVVTASRSADPAGGPAWALRLTRSQTGLTCTTVGQVEQQRFGIVGQDGVYRDLPAAVSDACGQGALIGSRIVADADGGKVRSIVYGVAGAGTRAAVLRTTRGDRRLQLGDDGTFVAALRGYAEDSAARIVVTEADGRRAEYALGASTDLVPDILGAPAWRLQVFRLGTRARCAHLSDARGPMRPSTEDFNAGRSTAPTACLDPRTGTRWAAYAQRLRPGQRGVPGFDRWHYRRDEPRTVVLGIVRQAERVRVVTIRGAGPARTVEPSRRGAFAVILPAGAVPKELTISVGYEDGRVERGKPGDGLVPDLVPSRRVR